MKNKILLKNVKFWIDRNVIHCDFSSKFDKKLHKAEIENLFITIISAFSNGKYKPLLIDLTGLDSKKAIDLYKLLSSSTKIDSYALSESFIVKSFKVKLFLELYKLISTKILPNNISTNLTGALQYSNKKYIEFNAYK
ncbi:hypothetical protein [Postechiella marina]